MNLLELQLILTIITIFYCLYYSYYNQTIISNRNLGDSSIDYCGSNTILSKLNRNDINQIKWKKTNKSFYNHCKIIHARYNCSRFQHNSASNYQLFYPYIESDNCLIPDYNNLNTLLDHAKRSLNVIFIGDSHVVQIFQSLLCIFQDKALNISLYHTNYNKSTYNNDKKLNISTIVKESFDRFVYKDYNHTPSCHSVRYKDYENYYLDSKSNYKFDPGRCEISHLPGQLSCFIISNKNSLNHLFCAAFVRPLLGIDAIKAGLYDSLKQNNYHLNQFDSIITNTYINSSDLANYLHLQKYKGKVIVLPRYPESNQIGFQFKSEYISTLMYSIKSEMTKKIISLSYEIKDFCNTMNLIYEAHNSHHDSTCISLDYTNLIALRTVDAKASIYPMSVYNKESNSWEICQNNNTDVNNCPGEDYRVCSDETMPCFKEGHFCLPGPTDEFALLLISAIISENNYHSIN